MKKFLTSAMILTFMASPLTANAEGRFFNKFTKTTPKISSIENIDIPATVNQLNKQFNTSNILVQNTFINIVSIISSEPETEDVDKVVKSILSNPILTEKDKSAKLDEIVSAFDLSMIDNRNYVETKLTGLSQAEKTNLTNNLSVLSISGNNYKELAKQYVKTASLAKKSAPKSQEVKIEIGTMKNTASALRSRSKTIKKFVSDVSSVMKTNGIDYIRPKVK